jgi:hypothetical protein
MGLKSRLDGTWHCCPASIFAAGISEFIGKLVPHEQSFAFRGLLVCFNFIWYFAISYAAIRTYRFVSETLKNFPRK